MSRNNRQYRKPRPANRLRIIGGSSRGRKIEFPDSPGLRPTGDRIRETLFSWLQSDIVNASCLDLFAGSGALGFEAFSRGAKHVTLVEKFTTVASGLRQSAENLGVDGALDILTMSALDFMVRNTTPFDIVFVDPPFGSDLLQKSIDALSKATWLNVDCKVYIESEKKSGICLYYP